MKVGSGEDARDHCRASIVVRARMVNAAPYGPGEEGDSGVIRAMVPLRGGQCPTRMRHVARPEAIYHGGILAMVTGWIAVRRLDGSSATRFREVRGVTGGFVT